MIHFDISNDFVAIKYQDGSSPFLLTEMFNCNGVSVKKISLAISYVELFMIEKLNREGWRQHQPFVS